MDSVAETTRQGAPLTMNVNAAYPQPAPQPFAQPNMGAYFQHPGTPNNGAPAMQSFYQGNPAAAIYADQQPSVQAHAPAQPLHLGASPDTLAGKFGGNMLALEILRSKLKMIAAYKNWQKRLTEYKEKMSEAAQMNPYNRARVGAAKHIIHKPAAHPVKPKAYFKHPKKYQTKKFPRTFPESYRYNIAYKKALYTRRSAINSRNLWRKKAAAAAAEYRQKVAEFRKARIAAYKRRYVAYPKPQPHAYQAYARSSIARPVAAAQPQVAAYQTQVVSAQPQVAAYQPQVASAQPQLAAYQPQVAAYQPQPQQATFVQPQPQVTVAQPQAQASVIQPQTQTLADQPQPQSVVMQPQVQASAVQPQPQTPVVQPQAQASVTQTQAQAPAAQPEATVTKATNDTPQAEVKPSSTNPDQSINDLKHDIENAIQDALNNKNDTSETKPAAKAESKVETKVLDISGSGSGSGVNTVSVVGGPLADVSGSGSASASGEVISKSNDKSGGEA